ncbi:ATP-grasp domain-containing protein [Streptomyces sp. CB01881]|uniref:ATP-grasp domain-containing protein n=1 Tax=Streptomyces sp. CB01881 TaxID=2078691 RepID=UPI000CDC0DF7|nr:ATP-grasp domain-containing protein [Streptomyces sp. CB01881]AUY48965.1 siderophore biosynthesis protein [Streptomyces sp. CB01881]TYC77453.1 ATP-grasp domain-containing protein [Streptomyces sp. CB01881]
MRLYLLALNPTDSVTQGFLPAAARLGLDVTVLTDHAEPHRRAYAGLDFAPQVVECEVHDFREVIGVVSRHRERDAATAQAAARTAGFALFSNSDHLQTQTALAAEYFGLPAKDWKATLRAKNKGELRRHLASAGADAVRSAELGPGQDPSVLRESGLPFPVVVKPREGVASEDVSLAADAAELEQRCKEIQHRRPGAALVVEEFLDGPLCTLETLGDGRRRHVLGGFRTRLSPPPHFIEEMLEFVPAHPAAVVAQVLAQLDATGVGLGACHTEFVVQPDGRARIIEVNYRAIGDQCDLMLAEILGIALFEHILSVHLGRELPADLGERCAAAPLRARNEPVCADRAGTLTAAPGPYDEERDGVRLAYRPLRPLGERHEHYRTNRDYLGVIWAVGPEQAAVDAAVARFVAANRWEITP